MGQRDTDENELVVAVHTQPEAWLTNPTLQSCAGQFVMKERSSMQINVTSIGPTQGQRKSSVLAVATAEITLFNGDQIDKIVISDLQVIKDADADILWVAFPGQRKSDGRWAKIVSTSTRLRRRIEDAVLEAYDRWCNAQPSNCAEANPDSASGSSSVLGGTQ